MKIFLLFHCLVYRSLVGSNTPHLRNYAYKRDERKPAAGKREKGKGERIIRNYLYLPHLPQIPLPS
jgi:hypothetical protein